MSELTEKDIELIERVLADEASAEEKDTFEGRKKSDPEFAARATLMETAIRNMNIDSTAFESLLNDIHSDIGNQITLEDTEAPVKKFNWYYIAASIVIILASVFIIRNYIQPASMESLYASNFDVPPENITTRNNDGVNSSLASAIEAYTNEQYQEAVRYFEEYLTIAPSDRGANFYLGISLLLNNEAESAATTFQQIINQGDSIYYNAAYWYLGLSYLKMEEKEKAIEVFKTIKDSSSSYANKASGILEKLE